MRLLPFLTLLFFAACGTASTYSRITINEQYSIELPADMEPAKLNENASLEYQNLQRELYAIVIAEEKKTLNDYGLEYDLETYARQAARSIDSSYTGKPGLQQIGNLKAVHLSLKGKYDNAGSTQDLVYRLTVIETPTCYYQVLLWTLEKKYDSNRADMEHIESSFLEVVAPAK